MRERDKSTDPETLARTYFDAWKTGDFDTLRKLLADDVTFRGPLGTADNADECLAGLRGMAQMLEDITIRKVFVAGSDAITWFDLHTNGAPPTATANWMQTANGKINRIRVTFDPRRILESRAPA